MWALIEGYLAGLTLVILIGPVLFVLLHATLTQGRLSGVAVALGIFISDVLAVELCLWGGGEWVRSAQVQTLLAGSGGLILLVLGLRYFLTSPLNLVTQPSLSTTKLSGFLLKGFLVNFVNPFAFAFCWIVPAIGGNVARLATYKASALYATLL